MEGFCGLQNFTKMVVGVGQLISTLYNTVKSLFIKVIRKKNFNLNEEKLVSIFSWVSVIHLQNLHRSLIMI